MNGRLSASRQATGSAAFNHALQQAARVAKHDHLVILITDYDGDDETTRQWTTRLAAHNDVLAVLVYDPLGICCPVQAGMEATDGTRRIVLPEGGPFAERLKAEFQRRCDEIRDRLRAIRIPILPICTQDPVAEQVLAALGRGRCP